MIDELDLAFDEHAERGQAPPPARRPRGGKERHGQVRRRLPDGLRPARPCSAAASSSATTRSRASSPPPTTTARAPTRCRSTIEKNATLTDIGNTLVDADVVKSTKAFVEAADDEPAQQEHPVRARTSCASRCPPRTRSRCCSTRRRGSPTGVTIPEGKTAKEIYELLAKATEIPVKDFEAAAKDPEALGVPDFWFNRTRQAEGHQVDRGLPVPGHLRVRPEGAPPSRLPAG